jgi:hypothetical protein
LPDGEAYQIARLEIAAPWLKISLEQQQSNVAKAMAREGAYG